jgi:hypothetical protein
MADQDCKKNNNIQNVKEMCLGSEFDTKNCDMIENVYV